MLDTLLRTFDVDRELPVQYWQLRSKLIIDESLLLVAKET